jgi:hypothetical protein
MLEANADPSTRQAIRARFARMSDANLRITLEVAREMIRISTRDAWRVEVEFAEVEIALREKLSAGTVIHHDPGS